MEKAETELTIVRHSSSLPVLRDFLRECAKPNGLDYLTNLLKSGGVRERFPFDNERFTKFEEEYQSYKKKDEEDYFTNLSLIKKAIRYVGVIFNWYAGGIFKKRFLEEPKYSDKTNYFQALIKLGVTLKNTRSRIEEIPPKISENRSRLEKLVQEESKIETQVRSQREEVLEENIEVERMREVYSLLQNYDQLGEDEKIKLKQAFEQFSKRFPDIEEIATREKLLSAYIFPALSLAEQLTQTKQNDLEIAKNKLESIKEQIEGLKRSYSKLWGIYNPAIRSLAKLHNRYSEMVASIDGNFVTGDLFSLMKEVDDLCEESRKIELLIQYKKEEERKDEIVIRESIDLLGEIPVHHPNTGRIKQLHSG